MSEGVKERSDDPRTNHNVCPNCQLDVLDGQGPFNRETRTLRFDGEVNRRVERWYQMRCPDCDLVFAVRERVVNVAEDTDNED